MTERIKIEMAKVRYYILFVFMCIAIFLMWTQYDVLYEFKQNIETLSAKEELIEDTKNIDIKTKAEENTTVTVNDNKSMKTILIWTRPAHDPLMFLLRDNEAFAKRKCKVQNCFVTTDKNYLPLANFDVVLFNGPEVVCKRRPELPTKRSIRQNYVFASIESSGYYPVFDDKFNSYFNISWTYKLNSDIFYGYVIIRDSQGKIIGPRIDMNWISIDKMQPINETIKHKLSSKNKLAAWLVSNCNAPSGRDKFTKDVQAELKKLNTNMTIDVYGNCGTIPCARHQMPLCLKKFEEDYYFYFSFENSFSEDYVTEKLLHPLQHFTVPVVYGSANYTRFMPDGIYLNAMELGPAKLAKRMLEIVADKEQYYNYFKWMNHYSFHYVEEVTETDFYCKFCEAMNNENLMDRTTVIDKFKEWWSPPQTRKVACPSWAIK